MKEDKKQAPSETTKYDLPPHHFIKRGMDLERVTSLVGEPKETKNKRANMRTLYYSFGIVLVENRIVRFKHPPSRAYSGNVAENSGKLPKNPK